jgi:hypothetical protein
LSLFNCSFIWVLWLGIYAEILLDMKFAWKGAWMLSTNAATVGVFASAFLLCLQEGMLV